MAHLDLGNLTLLLSLVLMQMIKAVQKALTLVNNPLSILCSFVTYLWTDIYCECNNFSGKFRTSNTCIPEHHALTKEVRMVRPSKGVSFRDERLAIAPGQGAPCVIFSTIPYSKTVRNAR